MLHSVCLWVSAAVATVSPSHTWPRAFTAQSAVQWPTLHSLVALLVEAVLPVNGHCAPGSGLRAAPWGRKHHSSPPHHDRINFGGLMQWIAVGTLIAFWVTDSFDFASILKHERKRAK